MTASDIDRVTALIAEASDTLILPRFGRLRPEDIEDKSTAPEREDLVTVVDREVEQFLGDAFAGIVPGATVIGEEAVHAAPERLDLIASDAPLWIIDPIDGTKNFARGREGFGVMVSYVAVGRARVAWVALPALGRLYVAEAGGGTECNGSPVRVPERAVPDVLRGTLFVRYMPSTTRESVTKAARDGQIEIVPDSACAAMEYTEVLRGAKDVAVYFRLLPWDHAAPALILTEAGGRVEHLSGQPYTVRSQHQVTLVARSPDVSRHMRATLRA